MDEEAIVNYYPGSNMNAPFQTATAFSPYQGGKKTEKVELINYDICPEGETEKESYIYILLLL